MADKFPYRSESGMYVNPKTRECLGYLLCIKGHGVYDAEIGKVPVTEEEASLHNNMLCAAELTGLDFHCQIGQGNFFYYIQGQVQTFTGVVVAPAEDVTVNQKTHAITFKRKDRVFQGILVKNQEAFDFVRVK